MLVGDEAPEMDEVWLLGLMTVSLLLVYWEEELVGEWYGGLTDIGCIPACCC